MKRFGHEAPAGLSEVLIGGREIGDILVQDHRVPVVSATGSTRMGQEVGQKLAARFARAILELGGNNAGDRRRRRPTSTSRCAASPLRAMGTAGQRCTTLRRLIVHESVYDALIPKLIKVYGSVTIGDPREAGVLVGPLVDEAAFKGMQAALSEAKAAGGTVHRRRAHRRSVTAGLLCPPRDRRDARADRPGRPRDLRADPLRHEVQDAGRGDRDPERRRRRAVLLDLHARHARGRDLHLG